MRRRLAAGPDEPSPGAALGALARMPRRPPPPPSACFERGAGAARGAARRGPCAARLRRRRRRSRAASSSSTSDEFLQDLGARADARRPTTSPTPRSRATPRPPSGSATWSAHRTRRRAQPGHPARAGAPAREQRRRVDGPARARDALSRGLRAGEQQRMKLRLYHHPDGARVAYREAGRGARARALALGAAQPPRADAARRGPRAPLPRRAARPAAARRLRGPPAPPVHARLAGRGRGRASAARSAGRGRSSAATAWAPRSCCARSSWSCCARRGSS